MNITSFSWINELYGFISRSLAFRTWMVVFCSLIILLCPQMQANGYECPERVKEGYHLLEKGKTKKAVSVLEKVLAECETPWIKAIANSTLGRACFELEQFDKAIKSLDIAVHVYPSLNMPEAPLFKAKSLNLMGMAYEKLNRYSDAADSFQASQELLKQLSKKGSDKIRKLSEEELVAALGNASKLYARIREFDKSRELLSMAEALAKKNDKIAHANLDSYRAFILLQTQQYDESRMAYKKLLQYWKKIDDINQEIVTLINLGFINESLCKYQDALKEYYEAKRLILSSNSNSEMPRILNQIGIVEYRRGNYSAAKKSYSEALDLAVRLKQPFRQAFVRMNIGQLNRAMAHYKEAEEQLNLALKISRENGYSLQEAHSLEGLAFVFTDLGKFQEALDKFQEALTLTEKIEDRRTQGIIHLRMGNVYERIGSFKKALKSYDKAASIQKTIGDKLFLSETRACMADIHLRNGNFEKALWSYKGALKEWQEIGAPYGELLCKLALLYIEKPKYTNTKTRKQDLASAEKYLSKAIASLTPNANRTKILASYAHARLEIERDPRGSIGLLEKLKLEAEESKYLSFSFLASVGLGIAYEKLENWEKAESAYQDAISISEDIRETLDVQSQVTFLQGEEVLGIKHVAPYEGLVRVRSNRRDYKGAVNASEATKARSMADHMSLSLIRVLEHLDKRLATSLRNTQNELKSVHDQLKLCRNQDSDEGIIQKLISRRDKLNKRLEEVEKKIGRKYPNLYQAMFARSVEFDSAKLRQNDLILYYDVTDKNLIIFAIKGNSITNAVSAPVGRNELSKIIEQYRAPLDSAQKQEDAIKFNNASLSLGKELFDILVAPVLDEIPESVPITIIPDEALALLPFEMLVMNKSGSVSMDDTRPVVRGAHFLIERNPIRYQASINVATLSRSLNESHLGKRIFILADPVYSKSDARSRIAEKEVLKSTINQLLQSDNKDNADLMGAIASFDDLQIKALRRGMGPRFLGLNRLKMTEELADYLTTLFPGQADTAIGLDANKQLLQEINYDSYHTLVFAAHGYFGNDIPGVREPVLLLTMVPGGLEDGLLKVSEVMRWRINAETVFLSSCQTGLGESVLGEGLLSMGRAFQYAGARSVIMSLWPVSQAATVTLVKDFFSHRKSGLNNIQALRKAKIDLQKKGFSHPFYWASFILLGEAS